MPRFVTALLAGQRPTVNGTGETSRDFTYIDNVVAANMLAVQTPGLRDLVCNVATGVRHSLLDLLAAVGRETGEAPDPVFGPARQGDILHSLADIDRARTSLGYGVVVPFEEGIARTVAWYRGRAAS